MASKDTQDSSDYSTHHDELIPTAAKQEEEDSSATTNNEKYLQPFHELPSLKFDDGTDTATCTGSEQDVIQFSPTRQNTRTAAQVTTGANGNALMLVPTKDSPLLLRNLISGDLQTEDDNISSAVEQFKNALKEVESAGRLLQECYAAKTSQREREMADCRKEQELCQQELKKYKEKCANVSECEKKLRQYYKSEIDSLEDNVTKLQLEKKEEDTTHMTELESLKHEHVEETKDLQHTIQLQAKHCREVDSELEELRKNYAKKEQDVAKLREKLERKERELKELGHTVNMKEEAIEAIKKGFWEERAFDTEKKLNSMLLEKDEMSEKLRTCQGISELVSRLPNVTSQAERDEITEQVMRELRGISRTPSAKKAKSWR